MTEPEAARRYAGQSSVERKQARRERLIEAGLEAFGTTGFASSAIERLCARASVSTRYFYEEFDSREDLLHAVYDEVLKAASVAGLLAMRDEQLTPVERIAVGVRAYVLVLTSDPRRTRVVHHEVRTVPSMAARRRETAEWVAEFFRIKGEFRPDPEGGPFIPGLALLGAVSEVLAHWTTCEEPRPAVAPMVAVLTDFVVESLEGYLATEAIQPTPETSVVRQDPGRAG